MADNISDVVASDVFSEWCKQASYVDDVLVVLDEFKGKDVYLKGWDFHVKIVKVDADADQHRLWVSLEAYCQQHKGARHSQNFSWNESEHCAGEFLYNCFMSMIKPFRRMHPKHS